MTQQLFNIKSLNKAKPIKEIKKTQQQEQYALYAKLIAIGIFFIIAIPIIAKIYYKGPFLSLMIGAYWIIIIAVALFSLGTFIKFKFFNKKNV